MTQPAVQPALVQPSLAPAGAGGIPPPPLPPVTWSYTTTNLITGQILATDIPLEVQSFSMQLNGGGTLTGQLDLKADGSSAPFVEALECRRSVLWALADGYPVWSGIVWDWPDDSDAGRGKGVLPIAAQTIDSIFSRRFITATLTYSNVDLFSIFTDLIRYATSKTSRYLTAFAPGQGPPPPVVTGAAHVAGLILPSGPSAVSGQKQTITFSAGDLSTVADQLSSLIAEGNFEYAFLPGFDPDGNLAVFLRLGITQLNRGSFSGYSLTYPGNVIDYGYNRTGSQSNNYVWATASPNGFATQWESAYPHGVDIADLQDGYPLLETTVSWQGTSLSSQNQVNAFADGQVALQTQAMTTPVIKLGGGSRPRLTDIVLGDWSNFAATSPLHPAGPLGTPGLQQQVRITGWTMTPPGPRQSESLVLNTSAIQVTSRA